MAAPVGNTHASRGCEGRKARDLVGGYFVVSWDGRILEKRKLANKGELLILWRPLIVGGRKAPTITGLGGRFLPKGIAMELLTVERTPDGFLARYGRPAKPSRA